MFASNVDQVSLFYLSSKCLLIGNFFFHFQLLEKALVENGNDLDSAIKSLNELCSGYVDSGSVPLLNSGMNNEQCSFL